MQRLLIGTCLALGFAFSPAVADATVIKTFSGLSNKGVAVSFEAQLTISGNSLTVVLINDSVADVGATTLNPDDLLTSFYFEITGSPVLTYVSATGDVYTGSKNNPDTLTTAGANLVAVNDGDFTWQFKQGLSLLAGIHTLTYGIGTAGNNSLSPNGFNGNVVDGFDYGIYAGDISTQNLDGDLLVRTTATFVFSGVDGLTEADIGGALFGLGTQPDSTGLPEPSTTLLMAAGIAGLTWLGRRRLS